MTRRFAIAIALVLMAGSVFADDLFTLYVPVQATQLHSSISHVGIRCILSGRSPVTGLQSDFVRRDPIWFPVTSGAYTGTATVVFRTEDFTTPGLTNPSYVNSAFCELQLRTTDGGMWSPTDASTGPILGHQAGTEYRHQSTRDIP
jgi:hypothetical protein